MSDTWIGGTSTNWFTAANWSSLNGTTTVHAAPTISATGNESVVIGPATNSPVISEPNVPAGNLITLTQSGVNYADGQIDGELITLTSGASLTLQGVALGTYLGNGVLGNITNLKAASSATPTYDSHMQIDVAGSGVHTLIINDVNHNFGEIALGAGSTLDVTIAAGGNNQAPHGLYNYGLISIGSGADFTFGTVTGGTGTVVAFYNPGWIQVEGGTFVANALLADGANVSNGTATPDGYIAIGNSGKVVLNSTVAAGLQINFTDTTANTLQITAGTLFSGTVNNFGSSDTIVVNGFTSTSNATITTVGGTTELITANGSVLTTITLTGSITSNISTGTNSSGQEFIQTGGNTLANQTTYAAGSNTLTGSGGTLANNGTVAATGSGTTLVIGSSLTGTGGFFIDNGATLVLANATGNDAGQTITFGTLGSTTAPNTLIINDNSSGFGGKAVGFGAHDEIVLGGSVLPALTAGEAVVLSYNTASGLLSVSETNASGSVVASTSFSITGTPSLTTGALVALSGVNGEVIELASNLVGQSFNFSVSGTGAFESPANYSGGIAPGDALVAGETVKIAVGTASVSSGGVADAGLITVATGASLLDAGSLTGAGSLAVAGSATLTGATTLAGGITDAGTLTLGGADATAISLASGAKLVIASNFSDTSTITGPGTLTLNSGVTATLASGSSLAAVLDSGTLDLTGALGGSINMEGNGANSVVDFAGSSSATTLTNMGTSDKIILSASALTSPVLGTSGVHLAYNTTTGVLTVTDTANSNGSIISTANITVAGTAAGVLSTASFVALAGAKGEVIELASSLPTQSFDFSIASGSTGAFESGANFIGGAAPGDTLVAGEQVTISSGTASVSSTGIADAGTIVVAGGAGLNAGVVTGAGTLDVLAGGNATLASGTTLGSILDGGTIALTGAGSLSSINMQGNGANSVVDFTGTGTATPLTNFGSTDKIIIGGAALKLNALTDNVTQSYNTATGVITVTDHTNGSIASVTLGLTTGDLPSYLQVTTSAAGVVLTLCFYPGTALATPTGEIKVEDIQAGDMLLTADGPKPVRWIGQSHIHTGFADPLRTLPIRIRAGALGAGLPFRDLLLSPDHAIHLDGILVQAGALVNGTSILRDYDVPEQFTYYHVELASHELLLAEGVQAESFVDNVERMHFQNWDARTAPYEAIVEMDMPRAKSARQVPAAIRRRLGLNKTEAA